METGSRRAAGERAADIEVVAVAIGARADDRVREGYGVRFRPGNLFAEGGGILRLVGCAGESRSRSHPHVSLAQAMSLIGIGRVQVPIAPALPVHRHDVEGGWHDDLTPEIRQSLGEVESGGTGKNNSVDVGPSDG